ncbi:PepSY domain-containing protein [Bradyrhizobium sp. Ce-3]|uniref:PepSY domain-containing protein n=1 Tax=Bradyrhizobium sp. Ce-3 TaxID=2913970 RepID=UPI001FB8BCD1|nr:PepSY domain-containing protein [Bradyrhizobium sp. Ce-3]GKQ49162.1 hypothetical protein BRSPCE3_00160 [Bradyrhizobium sp. Ce-3]
MRSFIIPAIAALAIGAATPAMAYDSGSQISMETALDVATNLGVVTVSNTQFLGDEWEVEGRDYRGRWMQVDVDARTGEVRNVDRSW